MLNQILKVCSNEKNKKYVLWGTKINEPKYMEEILLSECTMEQVRKIMPLATNDGYASFRVLELDNNKPDFISTIK